jgi:hypothetical protein
MGTVKKFNIWWKLDVECFDWLTDSDREHIAEMILDGYEQGSLSNDDGEKRDCDD